MRSEVLAAVKILNSVERIGRKQSWPNLSYHPGKVCVHFSDNNYQCKKEHSDISIVI
jgi:hypothetical protein